MNFFRTAAATAVMALAATSAMSAQADVGATPPVLALAASASVDVTKDVLSITFSTARDGADASAVQAELKQALDAALAEAKKAARPGQLEVRTGNFALFPRYANAASSSGRAGITGWQGSAELIVEGRDMTGIGQLSGRIATMTIARVGYRLSREASQRVEADVAAEAIARYRAKAADYAKQFGYAGFVIREVNVAVSEPQGGPMPMMAVRAAAASSEALSVEPGKATVTATVNGSVSLK